MKVNIRFNDGIGLCASCQHSQVMVDDRDHSITHCFYPHPTIIVPRPIRHCSNYEGKGVQSRHDLERIAWVLEFSKGQPIGFRRPKQEKE